jgi:adhesin/invasin
MRAPVFLLAALAVACSSDSSSNSGTNSNPTTPTTPTTNGYSVSVDSVFASRTAMVGTSLPSEVRVSLNGQPAAGVTITWTVSAGGGTANPTTSVSNSAGVATTIWTLGDTARAATLTGGITGVSAANLLVTATAGPATAIARASADSVAVVAGSSTLLTARVTDKSGNVVPGVSVAWTATGGTLTSATTVTGSSGNADVVFSTDGAPRSYTVTATVTGISALTFKVVGL